MASPLSTQRGEGKIGCIVSLLILVTAVGAGVKIVPVIYANSSLVDAARETAGQAALYTVPALELKLRTKASELGIPEAGAKGAILIQVTGEKSAGTCTITFNYNQKVDLYGVYTLDMPTHKVISTPYLDAR